MIFYSLTALLSVTKFEFAENKDNGVLMFAI